MRLLVLAVVAEPRPEARSPKAALRAPLHAGGSRRAWLEGGFYATAQVVYTLTARPGIERVSMRVGGRRCCVFDHSGRPFTRPLTRPVFAGWQGAP